MRLRPCELTPKNIFFDLSTFIPLFQGLHSRFYAPNFVELPLQRYKDEFRDGSRDGFILAFNLDLVLHDDVDARPVIGCVLSG